MEVCTPTAKTLEESKPAFYMVDTILTDSLLFILADLVAC